MNNNQQKFFLYARKSTDVEDKQVLSIEAQLQELRDYAKQENLDIAQEFMEKQSAKIPGRPIFNEMIETDSAYLNKRHDIIVNSIKPCLVTNLIK